MLSPANGTRASCQGGRMDLRSFLRHSVLVAVLAFSAAPITIAPGLTALGPHRAAHAQDPAPSPLIAQGQAVDWWFVFKFNTNTFPGCGDDGQRSCPFGGELKAYDFGQQFIYASSADK